MLDRLSHWLLPLVLLAWPLAAVAEPTASTIELQSHSPRFASDILDGLDNDPPVAITAILSLPQGDGPFPAMVIVHGSGGIGARGEEYQRLLNPLGIATLRTDSFNPRGVRSTVGDQSKVTTYAMVADAFAALAYLSAHPRIDPARIGIMGFSKGGSTAHFAAFEPLRAAAVGGPARFALHIPFYRGCLYDVNMPLTGAPIRELLGADDDYTGAAACADYAARRRSQGDDYEAIIYPGAHHGFNATMSPFHCQRCISFKNCDIRLDPDGSVTDKLSGELLTADNQRRLLRACTHRGTTVGGNPDAARQSREFVLSFLRERFGLN